MKLRPTPPPQKLRATAARRAAPPRAMDEEEEPTMRLSSAFIVVVLLHLVAVGGIFAFESVKSNRPQPAEVPPAQPPVAAAPAVASTAVAHAAPAAAPAAAKAAEEPAKKPAAAPARETHAGVKDSGAIHVVVKGENPLGIARKFDVSYDDLLKLNKIEDPRKLQIGQKLHIPAKGR